ncbi:hypothetical protein KQR01_002007 [Staphylococcus pseudintermedius]|nr:hypothetical protein [Staphylococcus pseudintermedius]
MIRGLIEKVEDVALRAIIANIETQIDSHDQRIAKLEDNTKLSDEQLSKVIAQIESDSETWKLIKKTFIITIVGGISGYILIRLGMK